MMTSWFSTRKLQRSALLSDAVFVPLDQTQKILTPDDHIFFFFAPSSHHVTMPADIQNGAGQHWNKSMVRFYVFNGWICKYCLFWFTACAQNGPATRRPGFDLTWLGCGVLTQPFNTICLCYMRVWFQWKIEEALTGCRWWLRTLRHSLKQKHHRPRFKGPHHFRNHIRTFWWM